MGLTIPTGGAAAIVCTPVAAFYGLIAVSAAINTGYNLAQIVNEASSGGKSEGSIEGTSSTVKTNLGNEIDITPSSNHSTTTKNPGYKGTPNSSIDIIDDAGNVQTRRWFGPDGKAIKDVDMTNHGNPNTHPEWPHEHGARR